MSDLLLSAETGRKEGTRPSRRLRREGKVPAVVYGLGGDPVAVSVDWPELRRCLTTDAGLNALITLDIDGANHLSVVKDIQRHPTRRDVLHVDFLRVTEDQQIEVNVPLVLVGEARNVTMYDGMVDQSMYEMTISVKPTAVPQQIEINIEALELGETIKVGDVELPEGAEPAMSPDETVAIALITRSTREAIRRAEQGEAADGAEAEAGADADADADADAGGDED
jgi:large subunit ribosomal protein L25